MEPLQMLLELVQSWLYDIVLWQPDTGTLTKTVALIGTFVAIIQTVKKTVEGLQSIPLVSRIPVVRELLAAVAHGSGPVIINILITFGTMAAAALSDERLQGAEAWAIIGAILVPVFGNDWFYKFVRSKLFPHSSLVSAETSVMSEE